ncbi:MAG: hypothetical protein IJ122_08415 [Methanobrevibacter sp.]|nr:hypothetical protein [Methanobrevibacter sp.]
MKIDNEEFSDKQARMYNRDIEKFENGNLHDVCEVSLDELNERIQQLESEIE